MEKTSCALMKLKQQKSLGEEMGGRGGHLSNSLRQNPGLLKSESVGSVIDLHIHPEVL
jgi:hypothetical protein